MGNRNCKDGNEVDWSNIPALALYEIACHLSSPVDFCRFRVVCSQWHIACQHRKFILPWLIAPYDGSHSSKLNAHCIFSERNFSIPVRHCLYNKRVMSTDAISGTVLAVCHDDSQLASLVNPFTGQSDPLPRLPVQIDTHTCTVSSEGAVLICNFSPASSSKMHTVCVAILVSGSPTWVELSVIWPEEHVPATWGVEQYYYSASGGSYIVCGEMKSRCFVVLPMPGGGSTDCFWLKPLLVQPGKEIYHSFLVESRKQLFLISIIMAARDYKKNAHLLDLNLSDFLSVSVHELETRGAPPYWVKREGTLLSDRILFLSWNNSFSVEAKEVPETEAGCMYFPFRHEKNMENVYGIYRFSFQDQNVELVDELQMDCMQGYMWFVPNL